MKTITIKGGIVADLVESWCDVGAEERSEWILPRRSDYRSDSKRLERFPACEPQG